MRRSRNVRLVLIGAAGLALLSAAGCTDRRESKRNQYASREDCLKDYPENQCTNARGTVIPGGGFWYGPWYGRAVARAGMVDPGPGATAVQGRSAFATASETRRGGFGATAAHRPVGA